MQSILDGLKNNGFATVDYLVFFVYLAVLIFLGVFLSRSKDGKEKDSKDYFLAGNTLSWWAVGASLIAANISAEQFIGMSGTAFKSGIAIAAYELMAAATLLVVSSPFLSSCVNVIIQEQVWHSQFSGCSCMYSSTLHQLHGWVHWLSSRS